MKKRWRQKVFIATILLFTMALTNPSKEDYIKYDEAKTGIGIPDSVRIAEANFFFFSVYASAPKKTVGEYGITYLGFMGIFIKVSNGQFDESVWKRFLK